MKLTYIKYVDNDGKPAEWKLERCTFDNINLIVGRNASGKSRTLNIISALSNTLSRHKKLKYPSGNYEIIFEKDGKKIEYFLKYEEQNVIKERLIIDGKDYLIRGSDGTGKIFSDEFQKDMKFKTPVDEVAASVKRDAIQHPFLDYLYEWGDRLIHFYFGSQMGKDTVVAFIKDKRKEKFDLKQTNLVVNVFKIGKEKYQEKFVSSIIDDMKVVGYEIDNIDIGQPISIQFEPGLPATPFCLLVKETDLESFTDQNSMSQGMFRALSLIVQINYASMDSTPSCIIIDDIGEGLDHERSTNLIRLIIKKAENSSAQLIMATNDRFVMNNVPLRYWTIINREENKSICFNYRNTPKMFEEFEFTGLNNFDLYSSNYFMKYLDNND